MTNSTMTTHLLGLLAIAMLIGAASASAQESAIERIERKGPLAGLPSQPGPQVEKIKALKDGEWLNLGSPAPDPKWGVGRGRSWSCKMPYAPDLQGAFLGGQGIHGFIKPDGHYMDDTYFYDVNGHRWICIYPGTDTKTFVEKAKSGELTIRDDCQLTDKDGQPVPFAAIGGHSYHVHTYDIEQRKYVSFWGTYGGGGDQYTNQMEWSKEGRKFLVGGKEDKISGTPFFFNTVTGKFERFAFTPQMKAQGQGDHVLFYIPTRKMLWIYASGQTMLGDCAKNQWTNAGAKGPTPPGSCDVGACYDSKRDRLYVGRGGYAPPQKKEEGNIYVYDVKTNSWSNPPNKENAAGLPSTNTGCVNYDVANDRVITVSSWEGKGSVSVYDPETGAWESSPLPANVISSGECWHGFYSPEVNAHFFYKATDSGDGTMWVYRYKRSLDKK